VIELISAFVVALVTAATPLFRPEANRGLAKRLAHHADLRSNLEGNREALANIDALLVAETERLKEKEIARVTRKLNGGNVAALIFVAVVGGGFVFLITSLATSLVGSFFAVVLWVVAVLVGLFTVVIGLVGLGTLYAPRKQPE
jgi:VIT1/CCC1 family predicted Fe2+/Mn2+ transporter